MAYCTVDDVRQVMSSGDGDPAGAASGVADTAVDDAINRAQGTIHTYLSARYSIPIDPAHDPDGTLRDWCSVIAAWYTVLSWYGGRDISADDPLRLRYNGVIKLLDMVRSGELSPNWPVETDNTVNDVTVVNRYEGAFFMPEDFDLGVVEPGGYDPYGVLRRWP